MIAKESAQKQADRLSEKAFSHGLWASVFSIVLCLALLCSVTYAWFSSEITSDTNSIVSGSFALSMQVTDSLGNEIPLVADDVTRPSARTAFLPASGIYKVTLMLDESSDAKGYCIVNCNDKYPKLTDVIIGESTKNPNGHAINSPCVFWVEVVVESTPIALTLEPCYGTTVSPDILYGETIHQEAFEDQH